MAQFMGSRSEFIDNPECVLKDVFRALTSGGEFLCSFERAEDGNQKNTIEMQVNNQKIKRHAYGESEISKMLRDAGFSEF